MADRTWMALTVPNEYFELYKQTLEDAGCSEREDYPAGEGLTTLMYYEIDAGGASLRDVLSDNDIPHVYTHGPGGEYSGYKGVCLPDKVLSEFPMITGGWEQPAFDPTTKAKKGDPCYPALVYVLTEIGWDEFFNQYSQNEKKVLDENHRCFNFIGRYGDTVLAAMRNKDWMRLSGVQDDRFRIELYERVATLYQIWQDLPMPSRTITDPKE